MKSIRIVVSAGFGIMAIYVFFHIPEFKTHHYWDSVTLGFILIMTAFAPFIFRKD